jgi:hypothetical protein
VEGAALSKEPIVANKKKAFVIKPITINVSDCQRCGGTHRKLKARPLSNPVDEFDHYATCPVTRMPLPVSNGNYVARVSEAQLAAAFLAWRKADAIVPHGVRSRQIAEWELLPDEEFAERYARELVAKAQEVAP